MPFFAVVGLEGTASAQDAADEFQKITLKQVMGRGWTEFERTFAALTADPRNDQAFGEMSVVVGEAGAVNKVAPYLEMLVQQHPDDAALRTVIARVYKDLIRDPAKAREHFEAILKKDPDDFFAHFQLGSMLARQGDKTFTEAVTHYRTAAEKVPRQHADLRTRILKELGDLLYSRREANAQYEKEAFAAWDAMTAGTRRFDLQTYEELAGEYRARSLWAKVQETYERYFSVLAEINDTPDNVTRCKLRTRIAEACENQGSFAKAIEAYTEAIGLLDENTWQRRKLESAVRLCQEKLGQSAAHEAQLRKAVADNPNSIPARQSLARMLVQAGRLDDAAMLLEEARKMSPRHVPVLNALESIYRKNGNGDALAAILRARIELSPEDFNACVDLADLHVRANRTAEAQNVLGELESSPSRLPEKFLMLARAYARYGMAKRAFVLYKQLADSTGATNEDRLEFCDFCLAHSTVEGFADEASALAGRLCSEGKLDAGGYVRLSDVFRAHDRNDMALGLLARGLSDDRACGRKPGGVEDQQAIFALNSAMSDLEHRMGTGHHAQAIGSTLKALLAAPDIHFKRALNDRLITLLTNYGHRGKLLYTSQEEAGEPRQFGGPKGAGVAPWVDFLNTQANSREAADLWMLLGQIHEAVEVDVEMRPAAATQASQPAPKRIKTDLAQARLCYQKVIDMEFQNLDAHLAMARVLADPAVDEYEKAINELEVLSLLNPVAKWESMQAIGDLLATAGENAQARDRWQTVAQQSAGEPDLLEQISMRMFRAGDMAQALELAQRARTISPYVFSYREACANLLARSSAAEGTPEALGRYVDEAAEALKLAQSSPPLADFIPGLTRALFDGRANLARSHFEKGDFKAARQQFEAAEKLLASKASTQTATAPAPGADRSADVQVQIARCIEALGDRAEAMRRYEAILKDNPDATCWVWTGMTVSGETFLTLKRGGQLAEGPRRATTAAAGARITATALPEIDLHDSVRALLSVPGGAGGTVYIEGARQRHRVDAAGGKLLGSSARPEAMGQGPTTLLPAGDPPNANAILVHDNDVRAIRLDTGQAIWTRSAADIEKFGRIQSVRIAGKTVIIGGQKGIQALDIASGAQAYERLGDGILFDTDVPARAGVVVLSTPEGAPPRCPRQCLTLAPDTGKVIVGRILPAKTASILWHPPVLAGDMVLLTDSLNGTLYGVDAKTGQDRFTFTFDAPAMSQPMVVGDAAFIHTFRGGTVRVTAVDLKRLRVRFDVSLRDGRCAVDAISTKDLPPLAWKDRLLYYDSRTGGVVALGQATGGVQAVSLAGAQQTTAPASQPGAGFSAAAWTLCGDTLCLSSSDGQVRMWQLKLQGGM
ncbi:MAG: PQQ-binding-like beta-propeller repeat protein [Phycisphaerae bacterium]